MATIKSVTYGDQLKTVKIGIHDGLTIPNIPMNKALLARDTAGEPSYYLTLHASDMIKSSLIVTVCIFIQKHSVSFNELKKQKDLMAWIILLNKPQLNH